MTALRGPDEKYSTAGTPARIQEETKSQITTAVESSPACGPAMATLSDSTRDWSSPDDPDNPRNWSRAMKILHTVIPASIAFVATIASSIYVPGRYDLMQEFDVSVEVSLLPYVLYVFGLGLGPVVAGPCSETFGRRAVYLVSTPIFALFILGSGFSSSVASLIVCRFFAGVFGSPALSIANATLSDIWAPPDRATPMALVVGAPFLGPALGPLLGGFVAQWRGWRFTQWTVLFLTVLCLLPMLFMQESYKTIILDRRAIAAGMEAGSVKKIRRATVKVFLRSTLTRPIHMMLVEPVVGLLTLYMALTFGTLFAFFASSPYIFETVYGLSLEQVGPTFLGLGIGSIVGSLSTMVTSRIFKRQQRPCITETRTDGGSRPEDRLYLAMAGSLMLPTALFWFGWSAHAGAHWICPVIATGVFSCGTVLVFMSAALYFTDFYGPRYAASALGAGSLARYLLGGFFPLFMLRAYKALGIGWATSVLGFISLSMIPVPWAFWIWGPRLRERSRYT